MVRELDARYCFVQLVVCSGAAELRFRHHCYTFIFLVDGSELQLCSCTVICAIMIGMICLICEAHNTRQQVAPV